MIYEQHCNNDINRILSLALSFMLSLFLSYSDCRVVRDPQTLKSKGYGFVSFIKKSVSATIDLQAGKNYRLTLNIFTYLSGRKQC